MEELEKQEIITIEYTHPKFWHRVMANLLDIIIFALSVVLMFICVRAIVINTPHYKSQSSYIDQTRLNSGLYVKDDKRIITLISYLEDNKNFAPSVKNLRCQEAVETFISYLKENFGDEAANKVQQNYDEYRLDEKLTYNGISYFIRVDDSIKYNPDCVALAKDYYNNVYNPYLSNNCLSYLLSINIQYAQATKTLSYYLLLLELPIAYVLGAILTYLVPPIFFKRGRQTFGKAIYHIGLVDAQLFSPSFLRYLARFSIFLFAELILSLVTFGIPFILSFSLMAFSKRRQGFPDYMLSLTEIDTSKNRVFLDKVDAELYSQPAYKKAIDFNLINKE